MATNAGEPAPGALPDGFRQRLPEGLWERLAPFGELVWFDPDATVMRRGDPPAWLYVIETGELVAVDPRTSPATVLTRRGPGEVFGEMSYIDGSPVSAEVRSTTRTSCWRFAVGRLAKELPSDPALDASFHRALAARLGGRVRGLTTSAVTGAFAPRPRERPTEQNPSADHGEVDPHLAALLADQRAGPREVPLVGDRLGIGRDPGCAVRLDDPSLALLHAELVRSDDGWRVVSAADRAVVLDGVAVASSPVPVGSDLRVGRARIVLGEDTLTVTPSGPVFALHVERVARRVGGTPILVDVSFTALAGEVIALVGPSGSGKTTLLGAVSGAARPHSGRVRLDREELGALVDRVPTLVGEVPQDDVVSPELTVEESLQSAARLRLPSRTPAERQGVVNRVLTELGLERVRSSRIGDPEERGISGGQRKRVNIGPELVTDATRLLFLDEPTSGLDPRSAEDVLRLARRLADAGRIVVIVTHDLSESVLAQVDHLLVMAPGGHLAWFGPVADACRHFGVLAPAKIFERLPDLSAAEWALRYTESPAAEQWVRTRSRVADAELLSTPLPAASDVPSWPAQWWTLTARASRVKVRDRTAVAVLGLQPLLVGLVILLVFPHATSGLVFLLALAAFWFGMSAAVRELIADRAVWRRERRVGVSASAWVLAKAAVLAVAVGLQCLAVTTLAHLGVGLGALGFSLTGLCATTVLTGFTGVATGLLVSASWRRADAAVGTIVLLLVPQMAFVGTLTPLDELGPLGRAVSWVTPLRYALHLALTGGDQIEYLSRSQDTWQQYPVAGELKNLGLVPLVQGSLGLPPSALIGALLAFAALQLVAAIARTDRK